jgi:hypothetical protein
VLGLHGPVHAQPLCTNSPAGRQENRPFDVFVGVRN